VTELQSGPDQQVIAAGETITGGGPLLLPPLKKATPKVPVIGVFATSDPRIDEESRERCQNIARMAAETISGEVVMPDKTPVPVVYSTVLVDGEAQADIVAQQFRKADVDILVCVPDTWAFPQLTAISLIQQFPRDTPVSITCGNSGPKPGVVFAHALNGALAQYGRMAALNVGTWADTGMNPKMSVETAKDLIDWCYAAVTAVALRGRRVVILGHDSMGMETALAHILATRNTFGIEITRLDMKLLADMLAKKAYKARELKDLRAWVDRYVGNRLKLRGKSDSERFNMSLAMYLIVRDLMADLNAVGGGFMSQLEWGSDPRGIPLPVADVMESFFNSTFDHEGQGAPVPFATEADTQALLTMLFLVYLSGGMPPLFMDFRKVWESWEIKALAEKLDIKDFDREAPWYAKGLVDGDNSGSAAFDWAAAPGSTVGQIMERVSMPLADPGYFPGGGNSVTFMTPAGIKGIAARMAYSALTGLFTMIWDQAETTEVPEKLRKAMCRLTTEDWPHTFVVPKYASMLEYKQYAPGNHFHAIWLAHIARLQHFMDLTHVQSGTPWAARPTFIEGVDRPQPLVHLINGGSMHYSLLTTAGRS
jgi:L-fucose isomerase